MRASHSYAIRLAHCLIPPNNHSVTFRIGFMSDGQATLAAATPASALPRTCRNFRVARHALQSGVVC
jgi:hypothetical protein